MTMLFLLLTINREHFQVKSLSQVNLTSSAKVVRSCLSQRVEDLKNFLAM